MRRLTATLCLTLAVLLLIPFGVQAGEIDGKAVLCDANEQTIKRGEDPFGLIFENGTVAKWGIKGYRKVLIHEAGYTTKGSKEIEWWRYGIRHSLSRDALFL